MGFEPTKHNAHDLKSRPVDQAWVRYHVSMTGFEPATFRLEVWRAIQLRHTDNYEYISIHSEIKFLEKYDLFYL